MKASLTRPRPDASVIEGQIDALVAELAALRETVRAHEARIAQLEARCRRKPNLTTSALLPAIAAAVGDRLFSAKEVIEHSTLVDAGLRQVLTDAGITSAPKLGKRLQAIEGQVVGDLVLERIGRDDVGVVWHVRVL
jgi:hypothetical protein